MKKSNKPPIPKKQSHLGNEIELKIGEEYLVPRSEDLLKYNDRLLSQVPTLLKNGITLELNGFINSVKPQSNNKVLYRFYENQESLSSVADKQKANYIKDLTLRSDDFVSALKYKLLEQHIFHNNKSINIIFYSPFISTTADLSAFINTTFSIRGDINVKQNIFNKAELLGAFVVPKTMCCDAISKIDYKNMDFINLPQSEKEVCVDTTLGDLFKYKQAEIKNPFKGRIKVDCTYLASRQNENITKAAQAIDKELGQFFIMHKNTIVSEISTKYNELYYKAKDFAYNLQTNTIFDTKNYTPIIITDLNLKQKVSDLSDKSSKELIRQKEKLIKENAAGDDRNLADHGDNAHYWYSIADGVRLLSWLRKQYITYTNTVSKEEEYIAYRENNNRVFVTDPYYAGNFDNYLQDDISRITEGKVDESTLLDKKWTSMPIAIIIPLLSGLHWRTVCITIDYHNRTVKILLDDPYGAGRFPEDLKNNVVNAIKVNVEKLIQVQTGDTTFKLIGDIAVTEKPEDQQGNGKNGWDCGPITFSNIMDYISSLIKGSELMYSITPYKDRNENVIINTRAIDIEHYSEIANLPINQERVAKIKEQIQKSRQTEIDKIKKANDSFNYDSLDSLYVDMLFKVLENSRILGISAEIGEYTKSEINDAYQVVLMEISAFTNFQNKSIISKLKSSKVANIFEQFQNLSKKEQEEFFEKIKNPTLKGLDEKEDSDIGWINSYFGKYTLDGFDNILSLRLNDLELKNIKTLKVIFVNQEHNNITELLSSVVNTKAQTILVPLNLFNKHAAGLIFEKTKDNAIKIKYLDPENKSVPAQLELIFNKYHLNIEQLKVGQQKYANCGAEVIENFILYLTGTRVSQEKAIELHSKLVENALLGIKASNIHLLFQDSFNNSHHAKNHLEQHHDYNNLSHNFDYDNHQLNLLGHHDAA